VPVAAIFENLKCSSIDEILENFPVSRQQVMNVLDFAAKSAAGSSQAAPPDRHHAQSPSTRSW
jgi:uncharacterized protein (DUF433 family)